MRSLFPAAAMRWMKGVAIPLMALVIGVAVAIASSPASLGRAHVVGTPVLPSPTPTPVFATPVASVTQPGVLGQAPRLIAGGTQSLVGMTTNRAAGSADGGTTWVTLVPPAKGSSIAMDPGNPQHGITGGSSIQFTTDGGTTWKPAAAVPPRGGPYQVLGVSPFDDKVWFFIHQTELLRTRDASSTWRDIPGLPRLSNPVIAAGPVFGEFFVADGNRVFQLIDNGQQVVEQPALPAGVAVAELAAVGGGQLSLFVRGANNSLYVLTGGAWSELAGVAGGAIAAGASETLLVGNGGAKLSSPGSISYSSDGGSTWNQATGLPYDQSVEAIAGLPSSTTFFAYCYGGDIYVSRDGGRSWTVLSRALRSRTG